MHIQFGRGFLLILDNLFGLHHCTLGVTVHLRGMTINTAVETALPLLVNPNRKDQCINASGQTIRVRY
jgi:hypothetical protein